ncbi:hypothetical protein [Saliniramus sp.]|nr:hypothetical protein [Saliniramus sp.]HMB08986.1 hypothetical protein [Saliniramus sp.]
MRVTIGIPHQKLTAMSAQPETLEYSDATFDALSKKFLADKYLNP